MEENDDTERFKRCSKSNPGLRSEQRRKADRLNASKETGQNRGAKRSLLFGNAQQYCETVAGELPDLVMQCLSSTLVSSRKQLLSGQNHLTVVDHQ